jgi:hypothetical protein
MLLLVVLLAQMMPPSPEPPDIPELQQLWEDLNSTCRKFPRASPEGEAACLRRDVISWRLGHFGWCVRDMGLETKWELCPPPGM